ncbi:MAG: diaminopimelate decarboxylase, partial [Actinomycetota bacterium]|nr:diaminopimelate decarboxylase [Actinomycetota bacterium]
MSTSVRTWWSRPGLDIRAGRLHVAGRDAESVAREHGTPLYVYDLERVAEQAVSLRDAVTAAGLAPVVRLALKAQREPELLAFLRERTPFVQMDVCSPGEIVWAINHGWAPGEISYTGTNVSGRDLE